jgi:hypothetical protein
MPQCGEIFTRDSLNDKSAALSFAAKSSGGHAAVREGDLRRSIESKRRVMRQDHLGEFSCHHQPFRD